MRLIGSAAAVAAAVAAFGVSISSLPNFLFLSVRRSINERQFSGMKSWERIRLSVIVSLVESIAVVVVVVVVVIVIEMGC